jgi:hypothetical protein
VKTRQFQLRIAANHAKDICRHKGVIGVLFLDKPTLDKYDDIDMVVFVRGDSNVKRGESVIEGFDVDVSVMDYSYASKAEWHQETRSAFENAVVLSDKGNKIKNLLKGKIVFPEEERRDIIVSSMFQLMWMGIYDSHRWADYKIPYYPHNVWVKREGVPSADAVINCGMDLLLDMLYAFNRRFIPDDRWKLCNSYKLKWLPADYKEKMKDLLLVKSMNEKDFERRYRIFRALLKASIDKFEREKVLPKRMYHHFLKHDSFYSLRPEL